MCYQGKGQVLVYRGVWGVILFEIEGRQGSTDRLGPDCAHGLQLVNGGARHNGQYVSNIPSGCGVGCGELARPAQGKAVKAP